MRASFLLLALCAVVMASSVVSANDCTLCTGVAGQGWCAKTSVGGYSNSTCMAGSVYGPTRTGACSGGTWMFTTSCGTNDCLWKCNLRCTSSSYGCTSTTSYSPSTRYSCSCNNTGAIVASIAGMTILAFALMVTFVIIGVCICGCIVFWVCVLRPRRLAQTMIVTPGIVYGQPNPHYQQNHYPQQQPPQYAQPQYAQPNYQAPPPQQQQYAPQQHTQYRQPLL